MIGRLLVPDPDEDVKRICDENDKEKNNSAKDKDKKVNNNAVIDNTALNNFEDIVVKDTIINDKKNDVVNVIDVDKEIPLSKREFRDDVSFKISKIDKVVGNDSNSLNIGKYCLLYIFSYI